MAKHLKYIDETAFNDKDEAKRLMSYIHAVNEAHTDGEFTICGNHFDESGVNRSGAASKIRETEIDRESPVTSLANLNNHMFEIGATKTDIQPRVWYDEQTNLIWELKTPENVNDRFVWSKEFSENGQPDAFSYAEKLNAEKFGGFDDWRLPTLSELEDLFLKRECLGGPSSKYYWSSTTLEGSEDSVRFAYFNYGSVSHIIKSYNFYVRCVRAGQ